MDCRQSEESIVTFLEYMKILHDANEVFEYEILLYFSRTCTGCLWQTAIMSKYFDRFGGFVSIDAIN